MDNFSKIVKDIKSIKIQGATNVAKAGLKALKLKSRNLTELKKSNKDIEVHTTHRTFASECIGLHIRESKERKGPERRGQERVKQVHT